MSGFRYEQLICSRIGHDSNELIAGRANLFCDGKKTEAGTEARLIISSKVSGFREEYLNISTDT